MKKIFAFSLAILLVTTACDESFLELEPQGVVSPDLLNNRNGVNALLIGAYSLLDGIGTSTRGNDWNSAMTNWVYGGVASDDAYKGTDAGDQPEITFIERYDWQSNNTRFLGKWRAVYDAVARCNDVIQTLPKVEDMTDAEKNVLLAEARFLRGHYHFEAIKMWENIPYIDENNYDPLDKTKSLVANDQNAWPKIEADFRFAADNLPNVGSQKGRADKMASLAYLAKAFLFQDKFAEAKPLLEEIVNSGLFQLVDFHDNFKATTTNNAESVFEVQLSVNDGTNGNNGGAGETLNWPYFSGAPGGGCCGFYQPSQNLVNAFKTDPTTGLPLLETFNDEDVTNDEGLKASEPHTPYAGTVDPRLDWTVGRRGVPFLDWGPMPGVTWIRDQSYAGPYTGKKWMYYKAEEGTNTHSTSKRRTSNNYRMIRYAQVLLWLAEAEIEAGSLEKARELVNQIRNRAKTSKFVANPDGTPAGNYKVELYPDGHPAFASKEEARKAVRFEQRLELAMEGHRFFDLVRWGIAAQTLNTYVAKESLKRRYLAGSVFKEGVHERYPLPIDEITIAVRPDGTATLKQNPGY